MELRLQRMYKEGPHVENGISIFTSLWIHSEYLVLSFAACWACRSILRSVRRLDSSLYTRPQSLNGTKVLVFPDVALFGSHRRDGWPSYGRQHGLV
jgi:hypothetical protein